MSDLLDPFALARRQIAIDSATTRRFAAAAARKRVKMLASPHAWLRGSAPLFYEILAARPELAEGPEGEGWIVGDMHAENVGAFKTEGDELTFDLNDFDDAAVGPLRHDVLRLATSLLLAARALGAPAVAALGLVAAAIDAHAAQLVARGRADAPPRPAVVKALIERAGRRSKDTLLDDRAPKKGGRRRLDRRGDEPRYVDLPDDVLARAPALLTAYVDALGAGAPPRARVGHRRRRAAHRGHGEPGPPAPRVRRARRQ
jgi:uncharacterized protein (DUF2252 family)